MYIILTNDLSVVELARSKNCEVTEFTNHAPEFNTETLSTYDKIISEYLTELCIPSYWDGFFNIKFLINFCLLNPGAEYCSYCKTLIPMCIEEFPDAGSSAYYNIRSAIRKGYENEKSRLLFDYIFDTHGTPPKSVDFLRKSVEFLKENVITNTNFTNENYKDSKYLDEVHTLLTKEFGIVSNSKGLVILQYLITQCLLSPGLEVKPFSSVLMPMCSNYIGLTPNYCHKIIHNTIEQCFNEPKNKKSFEKYFINLESCPTPAKFIRTIISTLR